MEKAWALLWTECRPAFRFPRRIFRFTSTAGSRDRTALPQNGKNPIPFRFYPALSKEKRPVPRFPWWYGMRISIPKITATLLPITDRATPTIRLMQKYGFRDYRGGGRSSGRETIARVAAGAIALKMLSELGITVSAYTRSIGDVEIQSFDAAEIANNALNMPDAEAAEKASELLTKAMAEKNSVGGVVECVVHHMPAGVGDPVFEKLDANLAKALVSIGAVKGVEIGDGFSVCTATGLTNNDAFHVNADGSIVKLTNHAGGILGGISDGSDIVVRAGFKPTPSVAASQQTINKDGENIAIEIKGRHDPIVVARAVVVVECMTALVLADALLVGMSAKLDNVKKVWAPDEK